MSDHVRSILCLVWYFDMQSPKNYNYHWWISDYSYNTGIELTGWSGHAHHWCHTGGGTTVVMCNLRTYYTLYGVCVITSRRNRGAAAEEDAVGEQQLKRTQSGSSSWRGRSRGAAAEEDAVGEQELKRTESGSRSWRGRSRGAAAEADTIGEQQLKRPL